MEDDELANKTPMEWRQTIYEEKLMRGKGKLWQIRTLNCCIDYLIPN